MSCGPGTQQGVLSLLVPWSFQTVLEGAPDPCSSTWGCVEGWGSRGAGGTQLRGDGLPTSFLRTFLSREAFWSLADKPGSPAPQGSSYPQVLLSLSLKRSRIKHRTRLPVFRLLNRESH